MTEARIVYIDDDTNLLGLAGAYFKQLGLNCAITDEQQRALDLVISENPTALVVDRTMPGMSGFDLAQRARELGYEGTIVMFTGAEQGESLDYELLRETARTYGIDDVVAKGRGLAALQNVVTTIEDHLGRKLTA